MSAKKSKYVLSQFAALFFERRSCPDLFPSAPPAGEKKLKRLTCRNFKLMGWMHFRGKMEKSASSIQRLVILSTMRKLFTCFIRTCDVSPCQT